MANRLLPFRQYDENDVINLYSFDGAPVDMSDAGPQASSTADAGVLVKVSKGNLDDDLPTLRYGDTNLLGYAGYPHIGKHPYPEVPWKVSAAGSGEAVLGITLKQTAEKDENGEKLLYYPQKKDELQAVLSGEAVPIATRGLFMIDRRAINADAKITAGAKLSCHADGKFGLWTSGEHYHIDVPVGTCLGRGTRASGDYMNTAGATGSFYYLVQLNPASA